MKNKRFFCAFMATVLLAQLLYTAPAYATDESFLDTSWFDPYNIQQVYEISTEEQLLGLASLTQTQYFGWNYGHITFEGISIVLQNDIYLSGEWAPIGSSESHPFAGVFDGNGYTISNITISDNTDDNAGVFGYVTGTVKNLNVSGKISSDGSCIGGIAGTLDSGKIINCNSEINVYGNSSVGGIAGENISGIVRNCVNRGDISGNMRIGGITGENRNATAINCINEGEITSNITGIGTLGTGGICGRSVSGSSVIKNCHNRGIIHSKNECSGGIAGYCNPAGTSIIECSNSAPVNGTVYSGGIAGCIGENGIIIANSYNIGTVSGKYSGGILGRFIGNMYDSVDDYLTGNYYSEASDTKAVGLDKDMRGKRNYTRCMMAKSHSYLESSHIFRRQNEMLSDKGTFLEQINLFNRHYFIDLFSNGNKYKGDFKQYAAEYLQIIN